MSDQLTWADVRVGAELPDTHFPLTVHRLVMFAGASRDFTATHHNDAVAQAAGAPAMFAGAILLQGMWERAVRDWIGPAGTIRSIHDFRMRAMTEVGTTAVVRAWVLDKATEPHVGVVTVGIRTEVEGLVTVGPGTVEVTLP